MPLPVAHGLLGATIVAIAVRSKSPKRDWRVLGIGAALAIIPDFDYFFYRVLDLGEEWHRTFTHSIVFAMVTGVLAAALFHSVRPGMALTYSLATLSHAALDLFTSRNIGGVELFWPFYTERLRFGFVSYHELIGQAPRPLAHIVAQFLDTSAIEFAVFFPIFLAVFWINRLVTTHRDV